MQIDLRVWICRWLRGLRHYFRRHLRLLSIGRQWPRELRRYLLRRRRLQGCKAFWQLIPYLDLRLCLPRWSPPRPPHWFSGCGCFPRTNSAAHGAGPQCWAVFLVVRRLQMFFPLPGRLMVRRLLSILRLPGRLLSRRSFPLPVSSFQIAVTLGFDET